MLLATLILSVIASITSVMTLMTLLASRKRAINRRLVRVELDQPDAVVGSLRPSSFAPRYTPPHDLWRESAGSQGHRNDGSTLR